MGGFLRPRAEQALCCFYGGFLPHFAATLEQWYTAGVRMFKIDFANFDAAPPHLKRTLLPAEIRSANRAWRGAVRPSAWRTRTPSFSLTTASTNGQSSTPLTCDCTRRSIHAGWRRSTRSAAATHARDTPAMNFWHAKDIYSDHMVRVYQFNDVPFPRIDNSAFMIGVTGTCYHHGAVAWRGMLVLSLAHRGLGQHLLRQPGTAKRRRRPLVRRRAGHLL